MHSSCGCVSTVSIKGLIEKEGKVLVVINRDGVYDLPGGRSDCGEDIQSTLSRELGEEVGIGEFELSKEPLFAFSWKNEMRKRHGVVIGYRVTPRWYVFESRDPEIVRLEWKTPDEFLAQPMPRTWHDAYSYFFSGR